MDTSPAALSLGSLIGNPVRDDNGASHGRIEELIVDPDSGHVKSIVLPIKNSPESGTGARAIPWETLLCKHKDTSTLRKGNEQVKPGSGKPDKENTFFVYTYSVGRVR